MKKYGNKYGNKKGIDAAHYMTASIHYLKCSTSYDVLSICHQQKMKVLLRYLAVRIAFIVMYFQYSTSDRKNQYEVAA